MAFTVTPSDAEELTEGDPDDDTLAARLTLLIEQVRTHLDTESSVLLTAVEDLIDDDTLLELGRRMEQRDRVIEAKRELVTMVPGGWELIVPGSVPKPSGKSCFVMSLTRKRKPA